MSEDAECERELISKIRARQYPRNEQGYNAISGSEGRRRPVRPASGPAFSARISRLGPLRWGARPVVKKTVEPHSCALHIRLSWLVTPTTGPRRVLRVVARSAVYTAL